MEKRPLEVHHGANVSGNLNTDYSVDGYMGKVDYNLNDKNSINAKYFYGTHTGLVVNSATYASSPPSNGSTSAKLDAL